MIMNKERLLNLIKNTKEDFKSQTWLTLTNQMIATVSWIAYISLIKFSEIKNDYTAKRYYDILKKINFEKFINKKFIVKK
jgi:hypothetical protein